jgi:hypothetical protein
MTEMIVFSTVILAIFPPLDQNRYRYRSSAAQTENIPSLFLPQFAAGTAVTPKIIHIN